MGIELVWNGMEYCISFIVCCWFYNIVVVAVVALNYNFSCRETREEEKNLYLLVKTKQKKEDKKTLQLFCFWCFFFLNFLDTRGTLLVVDLCPQYTIINSKYRYRRDICIPLTIDVASYPIKYFLMA